MELQLEINSKAIPSPPEFECGDRKVLLCPPAGEDYWYFRVKVSNEQAILGFPKFGVVGVGFAVEKDWNTNLPAACSAQEIFNHIKHNKGDDAIPDDRCIRAIEMIREAVSKLKPA